MDKIYLAAMALLKPETAPSTPHELDVYEQLTKLNWIDLDKGQLEFDANPLPLQFPCALIKVEMPETEALGNHVQRCFGKSSIRLAFDYRSELNSPGTSPSTAHNTDYFELINAVYLALQGKAAGYGNFERERILEEERKDGIKVVNLSFAVVWTDQSVQV